MFFYIGSYLLFGDHKNYDVVVCKTTEREKIFHTPGNIMKEKK